jgi:predicted ribosome quality control (RQC) complex YloA/Tae2 family protein
LKIIIGFDEYNKITQYDILDKAIEYINLLKKENDEYKNKLEKKVKKKDKDIEKITEGIQKTKI